jgi:hypothetical protein
MDFRTWLENSELDDPVTTAVLGIVAPDQSLSDDDKERELSRNTNQLSSDIQDQLKELGVVKQSKDYHGILEAIDQGILISDLIEKIKGTDYAPNADADTSDREMPQMPIVDKAQPYQQSYIQP